MSEERVSFQEQIYTEIDNKLKNFPRDAGERDGAVV